MPTFLTYKVRIAAATLYFMVFMASLSADFFLHGGSKACASIQVQDPYESPSLEELKSMKKCLPKISKSIHSFKYSFSSSQEPRYHSVVKQLEQVENSFLELEKSLGDIVIDIKYKDKPKLMDWVNAMEMQGDPYFAIKEKISALYENVTQLESMNNDLGFWYSLKKISILSLKQRIKKMASKGRYMILNAEAE